MNKPQIRFRGFTEEWRNCTIEKIATVQMNKRIFKHETKEEGDIPFYKIGTFGGVADAYISKELYESYKTKFPYPQYGDILLSASGSIGKIVEYLGKDEYFQDSNIIWLQHDSSVLNLFLKYFYAIVKWHGLEGSTIKRLYNKNILDTKIDYPHTSEQTKIGNFFKNIDCLLSQEEKKHAKLINMKKALLEKMFPQKGENVPQVRFEGFCETWVEKKLEELYNKIRNAFVGTASPFYVDNGHFYLESNNVKNGNINTNNQVFINDYFYFKQRDNWLHCGDLVMVQSGHVGHTAVIPPEFHNIAAHALIIIANPFIETNPYFINYQFQNQYVMEKLANITTGNTIKHILASEMKIFTIKTALSSEQTKIGELFKKLDKRIELQQAKITKLKNMKKALLDTMFV